MSEVDIPVVGLGIMWVLICLGLAILRWAELI